MSNHTKGPWELIQAGTVADGETQPFDYVEVADKRFIFCEGMTKVEANANAALCAVAPDMLEALEDLINASLLFPEGLCEDHYAVIEAKAIINKAKGIT